MPELQHLTPKEKWEVMRPARQPMFVVRMMMLPLTLGAVPLVIGADSLHFGRTLEGVMWIILGSMIVMGMRLLMVMQVRTQVQQVLLEAHQQGLITICLRCGFDLRGSDHGACPECGWGRLNKQP
ncbi:MAG TPA: hypothetical protein VG711_06615 [Phycisphaerales bacterium]|nr:hypothetical protein [Phycisphaerales bacterium]